MPGKDAMDNFAANIYEEMQKQMDKKIMSESDWYEDKKIEEIWVSPTEREQIEIDEKNRMYQKKIEDMMRNERVRQDPVEQLRKEMRGELEDIKRAIRKIGVMLDSDAPTKEMLEKHKTLRDAYRKYKMIEALILGQQQ